MYIHKLRGWRHDLLTFYNRRESGRPGPDWFWPENCAGAVATNTHCVGQLRRPTAQRALRTTPRTSDVIHIVHFEEEMLASMLYTYVMLYTLCILTSVTHCPSTAKKLFSHGLYDSRVPL